MTAPPVDPSLVLGDATPSLWAAALRLAVAATVLGVGAWLWLAWRRNTLGPTRQLHVLDRAFLSRGASVALLQVEGRKLLVGISADGVRLIRDMDAGVETPAAEPSFEQVLAEDDRRQVAS